MRKLLMCYRSSVDQLQEKSRECVKLMIDAEYRDNFASSDYTTRERCGRRLVLEAES